MYELQYGSTKARSVGVLQSGPCHDRSAARSSLPSFNYLGLVIFACLTGVPVSKFMFNNNNKKTTKKVVQLHKNKSSLYTIRCLEVMSVKIASPAARQMFWVLHTAKVFVCKQWCGFEFQSGWQRSVELPFEAIKRKKKFYICQPHPKQTLQELFIWPHYMHFFHSLSILVTCGITLVDFPTTGYCFD